MERKDRLIKDFADYRIEQLRDGRFTLYEERAAFVAPNQIRVGDSIVEGEYFIIATGSTVHCAPIPDWTRLALSRVTKASNCALSPRR